MKNILFIAMCLSLSACNFLKFKGTGNGSPFSVVVDGQSNGERLPSQDIVSAFAAQGYTQVTVDNIAVGSTALRQHMSIGDSFFDGINPLGHNLWVINLPIITHDHPQLYIWWQGEAESCYMRNANTYTEDFTSFESQLRQRTHDNFVVVYVRLSIKTTCGDMSLVRDQQTAMETLPNTYMVNIDDLNTIDNLHYGADDYNTVAKRIVAAYLNHGK